MLRTFRLGGIHPPENKLSAKRPIEELPLPREVIIPIGQHIGAPATPTVQKGDLVKVGTVIAKTTGFVSANIHSSVAGKVTKIDSFFDAGGYKRPAIVIAVAQSEEEEWEEGIDRSKTLVKDCSLSPKEIIDRISAAGIVGLGGATFPTHVKLTPPPGAKAEVLIINAVECEPYLTSDHALMMDKSDEILVGVELLKRALGVSRAVIGVENNKKNAILRLSQIAMDYPGTEVMPLKVQYPQGGEKQLIDAVLRKQIKSGALPISAGAVVQNVGTVFAIYEAVQKNKPLIERIIAMDYPGTEVMPLKVQYPQGGEKQLIDAVLRKQIKSGALPISAGAVVQNVGTVFAIYEAVQKNKPLIERITTVTGKHLEKPSNYRARIGTPIGHLITASGGLPEDTGKIIGGGPMMGKALLSADIPVTKGTSGILILPREESTRRPMRNCIRCAKCVTVCPMGLNPAFLMRDVQYADWGATEKGYIVDCIECGSCSYTCPANRPLLDYIRTGKQKVSALIRARKS